MKKFFIVLVFLFGTITTSIAYTDSTTIAISPVTAKTQSSHKKLLAASGCCKERKSKDSPWRKIKGDLDSCKKLNDKKDNKDNVFKPSGSVWWDVAC
jgi:hypothetical protein